MNDDVLETIEEAQLLAPRTSSSRAASPPPG